MINNMSYVCQQDLAPVENYASVLGVPSPAETVCVCTHAVPLLSVLLLSMADGVLVLSLFLRMVRKLCF